MAKEEAGETVSYIRTLSNPERLYIVGPLVGERRNVVTISHSVKPPLASRTPKGAPRGEFTVPAKAFQETLRAWRESYGGLDKSTKRGLVVEEIHVFLDTGKPVPQAKSYASLVAIHAQMRANDSRPSERLIRLSYKNDFIHMWRVTWMYIVMMNQERLKLIRRKKRK